MAEPGPANNYLHRWLVGVGEKLSPEGLLLLKLLYSGELSQRQLEDEVRAAKHLYNLAAQEAQGPDAVFALFFHRMSLLVPQYQPTAKDPVRIMKVKDLGAEACLHHLRYCQLSPPFFEQVDDRISPKSKLVKCLVTVYVNVSPRRRQVLREQLAGRIGLHPENFNIFQLVCLLFQRKNDRCEEVVGEFINVLTNAPVPRAVVANLRKQLEIPHHQFKG